MVLGVLAGVHLIHEDAETKVPGPKLPVFTFWGPLAKLVAATLGLVELATDPVAPVAAVVVDASCGI